MIVTRSRATKRKQRTAEDLVAEIKSLDKQIADTRIGKKEESLFWLPIGKASVKWPDEYITKTKKHKFLWQAVEEAALKKKDVKPASKSWILPKNKEFDADVVDGWDSKNKRFFDIKYVGHPTVRYPHRRRMQNAAGDFFVGIETSAMQRKFLKTNGSYVCAIQRGKALQGKKISIPVQWYEIPAKHVLSTTEYNQINKKALAKWKVTRRRIELSKEQARLRRTRPKR